MRAVNLIPSDQRVGGSVGAGRSGGAAYAVLALVVGVALLTFLYAKARHEVSSKRGEVAALSAQTQRVQNAANQLAPYTSFVQMREQRMKAVAELVDTRFDWAHAFHELGRVLPAGVSVSSLDGTVGSGTTSSSSSSSSSSSGAAGAAGATTVSSATPAGAVPTFTISGCATSQQTVAQTLQRLRLIDGVNEVLLQSSTKGTSSGGGSSSGGCTGGDPVFTVQVSYDALPSASASAAATKPGSRTVASTSSATNAPTTTKTTGTGATR